MAKRREPSGTCRAAQPTRKSLRTPNSMRPACSCGRSSSAAVGVQSQGRSWCRGGWELLVLALRFALLFLFVPALLGVFTTFLILFVVRRSWHEISRDLLRMRRYVGPAAYRLPRTFSIPTASVMAPLAAWMDYELPMPLCTAGENACPPKDVGGPHTSCAPSRMRMHVPSR
jgi:hypothetical protein